MQLLHAFGKNPCKCTRAQIANSTIVLVTYLHNFVTFVPAGHLQHAYTGEPSFNITKSGNGIRFFSLPGMVSSFFWPRMVSRFLHAFAFKFSVSS